MAKSKYLSKIITRPVFNLLVGLVALTILLAVNFVSKAKSEYIGIYRVAAAGNRYATATYDRTINIWDASTQQILFTIIDTTEITPRDELSYQITDLAFTPDGNLLAASFGGGQLLPGMVRIYDTITGNMVNELNAWSGSGDMAWKPDGTQLAARTVSGAGSHFDPHLMIWDIPSGDLIIDQNLKQASSIAIAWSPDDRKLATVDGTSLYLSDTESWARNQVFEFATGITDITWSSDGHQIAAVDALGTVYVLNLGNHQIEITLPGTGTSIILEKIAWNNNRIAVTSGEEVLVWEAITGEQIAAIDAPGVTDVAWLSENQVLMGINDNKSSEPQIITLTNLGTSTLTPELP